MEEKVKQLLDKLQISTDHLITGIQLFLCIAVLFFSAKQQVSNNFKLTQHQKRYDEKLAKKQLKQNYRLEKQNYKNKLNVQKSKLRLAQLNQKIKYKQLKSRLKSI